MSVKEFARITEQIGQSGEMAELYRGQQASGENMKAIAEGMALARGRGHHARVRADEAEQSNLDLLSKNQELNAVVLRSRNLIAEMAMRNAAFRRTIDHLKNAWGPERAAEIEAVAEAKDKEVREDQEFVKKVNAYATEKTQAPSRRMR